MGWNIEVFQHQKFNENFCKNKNNNKINIKLNKWIERKSIFLSTDAVEFNLYELIKSMICKWYLFCFLFCELFSLYGGNVCIRVIAFHYKIIIFYFYTTFCNKCCRSSFAFSLHTTTNTQRIVLCVCVYVCGRMYLISFDFVQYCSFVLI